MHGPDERGYGYIVAYQRLDKIDDVEAFKKTFLQRVLKFDRMRSQVHKFLGRYWFQALPEDLLMSQINTLMPTASDIHNEK